MRGQIHRALLVTYILISCNGLHAQSPNAHFGSRIRLNFGPSLGFYSINENHASDPRQKFSFLAGFNKEFSLSRDYTTFILVGADYLYHGLSFKSYYFSADSLAIYNRNFDHDYQLRVHELQLPVKFKYLFRPEHNSLFSPYLAVSYHLRYFLPAQLQVTYYGNIKEDGSVDLQFKTPLIEKHLNAALSLTAGWQKNSLASSKGSFFAELNLRYNFSPYYFEEPYAANSLYINSVQLFLLLGVRF